MKFTLPFFLLLTVFTLQNIHAQAVEITPSYGYQFGSRLNYGSNFLRIQSSSQFGVVLGYEIDYGLIGELSYIHHGTELRISDRMVAPSEVRLSDLSANWLQIGASKYFETGQAQFFTGGGLGLVFLSPKNENLDILSQSLANSTEFAFSFKGGVNFMLNDIIGINLQGNLLFPVEWGGAYIGAGIGGISTGTRFATTTIIVGLSGGLIFRLGA